MRVDLNLIRTILAHVEAETLKDFLDDAASLRQWKEGQLLSERVNTQQPAEERVVLYHLKLVVDGGFVTGIGVTESVSGYYLLTGGANPTLTLAGNCLLESLRTDGFLSRLKAFAKEKSVPITLETIGTLSKAFLMTI